MSLEEAILKLTAAVEANTAAVKAGGGKSAAASAPAAAASTAYTPKHDLASVKAMLSKVKDKHGIPAAKQLIKDIGGVDKSDDITDPKVLDALYEEAEKKASAEDL